MAYINSISIDGKSVTNYLLQHAKLIKIIISDKILVDHLFLVINKEHYKEPLPKEDSIIKFGIQAYGRGSADTISFYIYKDDNGSNRVHLTEAEKAIAKDPNNVLFHGLSVKPGFIKFYEDVIDRITTTQDHVFKNQTLKEVLESMKDGLGLDELVLNHQMINTKISYLKANKVQLKQESSYPKTIMEDLADIFYAAASVRNNKLYFLQKRYFGMNPLFSTNLSLSNSSVIDISHVKGQYDNQPPYKGVSFHYFEEEAINIRTPKLLGVKPFLQINRDYEKSLANIYAVSKLKEINEDPILKITLKDVYNKLPGYYLRIRKSISQKPSEPLEKRVDDILGPYSVKSCIVTYNPYGHTHQDPNKAGPSSKKPKLEPSWSTALHLIKLSQSLNK